MKTIRTPEYQCEICKTVYRNKDWAVQCESRPVSQDRGVIVGQMVLITSGDGKGKLCKVDAISILSMEWGHYFAERYWHTVAVSGDVIGSYGSRFLAFDAYEVVK